MIRSEKVARAHLQNCAIVRMPIVACTCLGPNEQLSKCARDKIYCYLIKGVLNIKLFIKFLCTTALECVCVLCFESAEWTTAHTHFIFNLLQNPNNAKSFFMTSILSTNRTENRNEIKTQPKSMEKGAKKKAQEKKNATAGGLMILLLLNMWKRRIIETTKWCS